MAGDSHALVDSDAHHADNFETDTFLEAVLVGFLSSVSLCIGSFLGLTWAPNHATAGIFAAFGAGALIAALSIELIAPLAEAVSHSDDKAGAKLDLLVTLCMSVVGGVFFICLDQVVSRNGGFLRGYATTMAFYARKSKKKNHMLNVFMESDIFGVVSVEELQYIVQYCKPAYFAKGHVLFHAGDHSSKMFFIEKGKVEIARAGKEKGDRTAFVGPGGILGEEAIMSRDKQIGTAIVHEAVRALVLTNDAALEVFDECPGIFDAVRAYSAEKIASIIGLERENSKQARAVLNSQQQTLDRASAGTFKKKSIDMSWTEDSNSTPKRNSSEPARNSSEQKRESQDKPRASLDSVPLNGQAKAGGSPANVANVVTSIDTEETVELRASSSDSKLSPIVHPPTFDMSEDPLDDPGVGKDDVSGIRGKQRWVRASRVSRAGVRMKSKSIFVGNSNTVVPFEAALSTALTPQAGAALGSEGGGEAGGSEGAGAKARNKRQSQWKRASLIATGAALLGLPVKDVKSTETFFTGASEDNQIAPWAVWLGILLDGVPESMVIGMHHAHAVAEAPDAGLEALIPYTLIAGLFLSNFPEALSSSLGMHKYGWSKARVFGMWASLTVITSLGAGLGYAVGNTFSGRMIAGVQGLAAGAMLTMIAGAMLPEALESCGNNKTGITVLLGFVAAVAFKLLE